VLLTPVANLPLVSLMSVAIRETYQTLYILKRVNLKKKCIFMLTGGKFTAGVIDTGGKFVTGVVDRLQPLCIFL
jgi:hypothetical protein